MKKWLIYGLMLALLLIPIKAEAYTNSTIYCEDANILIENITVYVGANSTTLMLPSYCSWGCDNTTLRCSPDPFMQNLIFFGITVFFIFVVVLIWKLK